MPNKQTEGQGESRATIGGPDDVEARAKWDRLSLSQQRCYRMALMFFDHGLPTVATALRAIAAEPAKSSSIAANFQALATETVPSFPSREWE